MIFKNKTILIISQQEWGLMRISKHHYALELAKKGNKVFYLTAPDNNKWVVEGRNKRISIKKSEEG
ncbi:hypothetical protein MASR1M65_18510 [Saprospiraceae bacterium]